MKVSLKAFFWGCVFSIFIIILDVAVITKIQRFGLCVDTIGAGALFCLFALVILFNPIFRRISKRLVLNSSELLSVYSMVLVSSTIPTWGLMCTLTGTMSAVQYFATPENRWESIITPLIKPWLILQDKQAATYFFESIPKGIPIPFKAWLVPLFSWFIFMILLYLVSMFIGVIFRKQWVENERLVFPLTVLPVEMVKGADGGNIPDLFKNKMMWFGFITSAIVVGLQMLHSIFPIVPYLKILSPYHSFPLFRRGVFLVVDVYFVIVGFAFLLNTTVAFSLWVFPLYFILQNGILSMRGFTLTGPNETYAGYSAFSSFQGMGGMICLVFFVIWIARGHLSKVLRRAFTGEKVIDDSEEPLSYRSAVFGLFVSLVLLLFWLKMAGMPFAVAFLFVIFSFIMLLGLTRIVCEGGVGFIRGQCQPMHMVAYSLSPNVITPQGYASLALHFSWVAGQRNNTMTSVFNSFKIAEGAKIKGRSIFYALLISIVISYVVSAYVVLKMNYKWGALNSYRTWFFIDMPKAGATFTTGKLLNPPTSQMITQRLMATGVGIGMMAFLIFMRYRFLWWPLHPLGFPVADSWIVQQAWFSIFLAWLLKILIIRFGGLPLYKRSVPYFLGLILGQIVPVALWILINWIMGNSGMFQIPIGLE